MVFQDARVLVTGAASGLGAALTAKLREAGARVLATDLSDVSADGSPDHLRLDITSDDDWAAAVGRVEEELGRPRRAGQQRRGGRRRADRALHHRRVAVDHRGEPLRRRARHPRLRPDVQAPALGGRIVNVASLAGLVHPAGMGSYNAVKAAVVAFTETTGHELAAYGVQAHAVCPSYFRTNLPDSLQGTDAALGQVMSRLVDDSPYTADDIAAAVLEGVERGDELIVPDDAARFAYELKQSDRAAYDAMMRKQAAKLEGLPGTGETS